jgi:hypothetical protein
MTEDIHNRPFQEFESATSQPVNEIRKLNLSSEIWFPELKVL